MAVTGPVGEPTSPITETPEESRGERSHASPASPHSAFTMLPLQPHSSVESTAHLHSHDAQRYQPWLGGTRHSSTLLSGDLSNPHLAWLRTWSSDRVPEAGLIIFHSLESHCLDSKPSSAHFLVV